MEGAQIVDGGQPAGRSVLFGLPTPGALLLLLLGGGDTEGQLERVLRASIGS